MGVVIAGLNLAYPGNPSNLRKCFLAKKMDARVKPAHDRVESLLR